MKKLNKNSKIAVVAPAGALVEKDLEWFLGWTKNFDFQIVLGDHLFALHNFGYRYAGTDEHRIADFQNALDDDEVDAIWMARGGYGGIRILEALDFTSFKKNPKWLIGYSDNTVFHQYLNKEKIPTLHACTAKQLGSQQTEKYYDAIADVLLGKLPQYRLSAHNLNQIGKTKAPLVGGNLSILYSLLGTPHALQTNGKILFIEDWQENWYHLDRMMMAMRQSGVLKNIAGLVVGSFTKMDLKDENPNYRNDYDALSEEIIRSYVPQGTPALFGFPAGHITHHYPLIFGKDACLEVDAEGATLIF